MIAGSKARERRWFAPEVVQTSTMDCGPAALKCLLEGHHVPVSYGRLREACQTSVDGTSIDTIEVVAAQLGLSAEQVLIPLDHVTLDATAALPAIVVVRHADAATHFVVVWRRKGRWLQIMDPALGRRWVTVRKFQDDIYRHELSVEAPQWRAWAGSDECLEPLRARLAALGIDSAAANSLIAEALTDREWYGMGAFDASVRLVQSLLTANGVTRGKEAEQVVAALYRDTFTNTQNVYSIIPGIYWSVSPDASNTDPTREMLRINGSVVLKVAGLRSAEMALTDDLPLSAELEAALTEKPVAPLGTLWRMLREDGLTAPLALVAAMAIASGALMLEMLLFRGLFDIAALLNLSSQRLFAAIGLLVFVGILIAVDLAIGLETLRQGRQLEMRLRVALLRKLPRLNDRYFQSRPITDMADRNHNIHTVRNVPAMGLQCVQSLFELVLTFGGIMVIAPGSLWYALALSVAAIATPLAIQPLLNERDLRTRNHAGALHGFYLDAMLGLAPIRAHRAERNVQRQHESLLVEWALSLRSLMRLALLSDGAQALICTGLAAALLVHHFMTQGQVSGGDLLLIFWTLKLPAVGGRLAGLAHQYPAMRNVLLRLLEPLNAPEETDDTPGQEVPSEPPARGVSITITNGNVLAGGHNILRDVDLRIAPGEHVAIVGKSGAGKSSLLGLLLGWHKLESGRLAVDGQHLDARATEALRQTTAWVDPAIQIWNRSLLDNLTYALDGSALEQVGTLIETSGLRGVARKLPQGLQTRLGEGGGLLSGGEGQRVRLGRALLATNTRLALLDEPFRGLDRTQRRSMLTAARKSWDGVTLLCVTHDVSETLDFDRVLVIEDGRIVEDEAPRDLAARPSRYAELLAADADVQNNSWRGSQWRRIAMVDGHISQRKAA
jgi:ABC-type bacteriocin/lantibiotic exporter with double-glycine peptidase domain